uniref:RPW8 domain-containing protein n=1 Tax=Brassica oleracea var. oleracea TaxID=109376 RepID=A0A0D3AXB9_BRAOL
MSVWLGRGFLSNSNLLETLIFAAKISTDFKPLSEDLASTLERLIPLSEEIESFQGKLDFAYGDLKELVDTLFRAREVVNTCIEGVSWFQKPILTREIQRIVNDMLKFSRTELHFLQFRTLDDGGLCKTIDCFSVPVYTDLCSVLLPDKDLLGFDYPLMELKKKLRDDSVGCLVVCAPPGFGKTTLVAQLCHDQEIKDSLAPPPLVFHLELVSFTGEQCDHRSYRYNATVMIISPDEGLRSLPRRSLYQPSSWMRS